MADQKHTDKNSVNAQKYKKHSLSTIAEELKSHNTTQDELDKPIGPEKPARQPLVYVPPPKKPVFPCEFRKQFRSAKIPGCSERLGIPHDKIARDSMVDKLMHRIKTDKKPLFKTVVVSDGVKNKEPSILVTGFGLRNLSSLQEALGTEEQRRLKELYKPQERIEESDLKSMSSESIIAKTDFSSGTQTEVSSIGTEDSTQKRKMVFLLGLQDMDEEGEERGEEEVEESMHIELLKLKEEEEEVVMSEAMRQAQGYLRVHHIFKLFQFISAHLLSALPDNPIEFILDLLDKCLVFRSGFIDPPLLYTRKHLECLFYLMDRMRTGYIELTQYNTGMHTLGICEFNRQPNLTQDDMVAKEDFVEEAYNRLTDQMNEMLRHRLLHRPPPVTTTPPPSVQSPISFRGSMEGEYRDNFLDVHTVEAIPCLQLTNTKLL